MNTDVVIQGSTSQQKLCANVAAQIVAFACGKEDENRNKNFEGGRPSSIIIGEQLNPETLGALLSHFENKVMFQGFVWNVNSFDQEGVQLGKVLAKRVLAHETDGGTESTQRSDEYLVSEKKILTCDAGDASRSKNARGMLEHGEFDSII